MNWIIRYVFYFANFFFIILGFFVYGRMEVLKDCALVRSFAIEHMTNLEVLMACHVL